MEYRVSIIDNIPVTDEVMAALSDFYLGRGYSTDKGGTIAAEVDTFIQQHRQSLNNKFLTAASCIAPARRCVKSSYRTGGQSASSEEALITGMLNGLAEIIQRTIPGVKQIPNSSVLALYQLAQPNILWDPVVNYGVSHFDLYSYTFSALTKLLCPLYGLTYIPSFPSAFFDFGWFTKYSFTVATLDGRCSTAMLLAMSAVLKTRVYLIEIFDTVKETFIAFDFMDELIDDEKVIKAFTGLFKCTEDELTVEDIETPEWSELADLEWVDTSSW